MPNNLIISNETRQACREAFSSDEAFFDSQVFAKASRKAPRRLRAVKSRPAPQVRRPRARAPRRHAVSRAGDASSGADPDGPPRPSSPATGISPSIAPTIADLLARMDTPERRARACAIKRMNSPFYNTPHPDPHFEQLIREASASLREEGM